MACDSAEDIEKDFIKTQNELKKAGLRDGISDGRDSNFQGSFDDGFQEGFKTSFAIGQYKGALFAAKKSGSVIEEHELMEKPTRGWCQTCFDTNFAQKTIPEIVKNQMEATNRNLEVLHSLYSDKCDKELPERI